LQQAFPPLRDISRQIDAERKRGATHLAVVTEKLSAGGRRGKPSVHSCRGETQLQLSDSCKRAPRYRPQAVGVPGAGVAGVRWWARSRSLTRRWAVGTEQIYNEARRWAAGVVVGREVVAERVRGALADGARRLPVGDELRID